MNADGSIDCEFRHPAIGWIPYTARESDPYELGRMIFAEALRLLQDGGGIPVP
jgi:hypothetical protein